MSGFTSGAGPNGPVLTLDARSETEERPYIVIKTDAYPEGERFYCPDLEDMDVVQIAHLQWLARRFDDLRAQAEAYAADPEQADPTVAAEFNKTIDRILDMMLPDLPVEARRRMGAMRVVPIIEAFFAYLLTKLGATTVSTVTPATTRRTGGRSSRASRASTPASIS